MQTITNRPPPALPLRRQWGCPHVRLRCPASPGAVPARPDRLDRAAEAYDAAQVHDLTRSQRTDNSPALAGWGGGDR
jgi:hypothetical protein